MNPRPRILPLDPHEWSTTAREAIAILSEEASRVGLDPDDDTHIPNLICTQLQHPELMKAFFPLIKYLLWEGTLDARLRELAVLRVAWLRQTEYEWTQHVMIAREAGISDEELARITGEPDPSEWNALEAAVIQAVDELIQCARITDKIWETLRANLGEKKLIELVHVIGNYDTIAMFMNATGLELEAGLDDLRFSRFTENPDDSQPVDGKD